MGQEIGSVEFGSADFDRFGLRLEAETDRLRDMWRNRALSSSGPVIGFELEAWLVDRNFFPAPDNQSFLARLADPLVVAELSRFNIELNGTPRPLGGEGLGLIEREMAQTWQRCLAAAHGDVDTAIAIGTLPTLREADLSSASMTPARRYAALNKVIMEGRGNVPVPIHIDSVIEAGSPLVTQHRDVMLEAATTSFQLHLQVPSDRFVSIFNASLALSGPLLALSANSPFLFGHALWHETRIPVFEQAFAGPLAEGEDPGSRRVGFGSGYLDADPLRLFEENLRDHSVLLPVMQDGAPERLPHLRLHNGTVWRWNRPLVGFDPDGTPHLRLELRIMPAGPSLIDMVANAAFAYGALFALAEEGGDVAARLPFARARGNFYAAARHGLMAEQAWLDGQMLPARAVLAAMVPAAREGLLRQGVARDLVDRYLDVIEVRLASGQNGAEWQLAHYRRHGDLFGLTADYLENQRSGMPVHEWRV